MSENIIIAVLAAIPPTLGALAALYQVRKLSRPVQETNAAVNHRNSGQKRLVELVDDIHHEVHRVSDDVREVRDELAKHRAWHLSILEGENDDPSGL